MNRKHFVYLYAVLLLKRNPKIKIIMIFQVSVRETSRVLRLSREFFTSSVYGVLFFISFPPIMKRI
jgi:hypothetical protein